MDDAARVATEVVRNIDDAMHDMHISQLELEKRTGIDHKRISRYVNGTNKIPLEAAIAMSEGVGGTLDLMLPPEARSSDRGGEDGKLIFNYHCLNRENRKKLEDYMRLLLMDQKQ